MERPRLESLGVGRFLSYDSQIIDFRDAIFLVGRNGAGKSNIARAVWMLGRVTREPLRALLDERGGFDAFRNRVPGGRTPGLHQDLSLLSSLTVPGAGKGQYNFALWAKPDSTYGVWHEYAQCGDHTLKRAGYDWIDPIPGFDPSLRDDDALLLPLVAGSAGFAPLAVALESIRFVDIVPDRLRDYQNHDNGLVFRHDGSNATSVLREMVRHHPERHARLCEFLSAAVPGVIDVQPKPVGSKLTLEFTQSREGHRLAFESVSMSDGTLRIFGILLALLQPLDPMMVVIEEPETAVHPGALAVLSDAMYEARTRSQLLVTTQSPELLDADWIEEEDVRIVHRENGFSRVSRLDAGTRDVLKQRLFSVGEMLRDNALEGEAVSS